MKESLVKKEEPKREETKEKTPLEVLHDEAASKNVSVTNLLKEKNGATES